jgi:asparagine synthase (glutamine-hydrolysing)
MFAIALWDARERALHIARDRFGEKPLYYGTIAGGMTFGSELRPLRVAPGFRGTIDHDAVASYMRHGYINAPASIFREVRKLEPATIATFRHATGEPVLQRYWSLEDVAAVGAEHINGSAKTTDAQSLDQLDALLREAVADQMLADVPLGAFLSGGVDSSLIVALMQAQSSRPVRTFTIGFEEAEFNEAPHAEAVAKHLGTSHTTMFVRARDALDLIPRLPAIYDEPFADSSQIPTTLVAALAKQHVTVALSGDGGDELFGGYSRYHRTIDIWKQLRRMPTRLRRAAAAAVTSIDTPSWDAALQPTGLARRGLSGDRLHKLMELFEARDSAAFYRDFVSAWRRPTQFVRGSTESVGAFGVTLDHPGGLLAEMMLRDQLTYLPGDILVKVDRAAMASSLESRAPLLDHRVAEFAWRLPRDKWVRNGRGKWILRALLDRYVPNALIERPKQGFGVPYAEWLRGPLREWADDLLSPEALAQDDLFDTTPILRRWQEHRSGVRNWAPGLWSVLMLQAWRRFDA